MMGLFCTYGSCHNINLFPLSKKYRYLNEQVAAKQRSETSRGVYVFSDMNPYVGHPNPLKEGQELFRKGLLSEAVLALEAEVLKNPENAEGWRLLGIAHAENDDDQQVMQLLDVESFNYLSSAYLYNQTILSQQKMITTTNSDII
jgi:predicted Zn-dependent protease